MSSSPSHLVIGLALMVGLGACVPTTSTSTNGTAPLAAPAKTEGVYLATADNGFTVPAVPPEKVPDEFERQVVEYETGEAPGTIIINPATKHLYFVLGKGKAIRYGIAVGNPATLVVLQAEDAFEAIRLRAARLFVLRNGRVIAHSPRRSSRLHLAGRPESIALNFSPGSLRG